jgi:hypothetical protein
VLGYRGVSLGDVRETMGMDAMCDTHRELHLGYQYRNQLKLLEELNPLERAVRDQLDQPAREFLDEAVVVEVMEDQERCCTTALAFHFHQE